MLRLTSIGACGLAVALLALAPALARDKPQEPSAETPATPAKGMLLIAGRDMPDPRFRRSVIVLLSHDARGSLGLIVNRPSEMALTEVLPELDTGGAAHPLYFGGPVGLDHLELLVHDSDEPAGAAHLVADTYVSGDRETLVRMLAQGKGDDELRAYVGYAGWGPGQLASELAREDWYVQPARESVLFSDEPAALWPNLIEAHDPAGQRVWRGPGSAARTAQAR